MSCGELSSNPSLTELLQFVSLNAPLFLMLLGFHFTVAALPILCLFNLDESEILISCLLDRVGQGSPEILLLRVV